jgi:hypothetical protein
VPRKSASTMLSMLSSKGQHVRISYCTEQNADDASALCCAWRLRHSRVKSEFHQ